jgi:hypothetical protein
MSNPISFITNYTNNIVTLVEVMENLRVQNDMIDQDSTLIDRYFAAGPMGVRTDIDKAAVTAAHDALVQLLFTYDSGSPSQKSSLYKMMP